MFRPCPLARQVAGRTDIAPTGRHADIVLPSTTFWERNDVHTP